MPKITNWQGASLSADVFSAPNARESEDNSDDMGHASQDMPSRAVAATPLSDDAGPEEDSPGADLASPAEDESSEESGSGSEPEPLTRPTQNSAKSDWVSYAAAVSELPEEILWLSTKAELIEFYG